MTYIPVKTVTTVVRTTVLDSTIIMCLYLSGSSQHVASLYTGMLLLELIPGATRPSTDINNNNIIILVRSADTSGIRIVKAPERSGAVISYTANPLLIYLLFISCLHKQLLGRVLRFYCCVIL